MEHDFEGRDIGAGITIIRLRTDEVGAGPNLHQHPYRETIVILHGSARFTIGDQEREGTAGDVLVIPASTPHKFAVLGPGTYEAVDIHESDHFITEWLERDDAS
ncbi:cupin domain-containing protein [Amycolatopsis sp. lyj-112]|uniref:cupin domain-containing protein n=1 Tax=Amycolatopsis sp. lyj-112 TaxID=2789288 RepID=UPI00397C356C